MRRLLPPLLALAAVGCRCDKVQAIKPSIAVMPPALDFGPVKNGDTQSLSLKLSAQTATDVSISKLELASGTDPGGAEGFTLKLDPIDIGPLDSTTLPVAFHPTALQEYSATLTLTTNDEEKPTIHVPLLGQGSKPILKVLPDCAASRMCQGTVVVDPPSIDFGAQPYNSMTMIDASKLPAVDITNEGDVSLTITKLEVQGTDAAAFVIQGTVNTPLMYDPMAGVNVPIRFVPKSDSQMTYDADLDVESDDPDHAQVKVHLHGTLLPNQAPIVCANLIKIVPSDDPEMDFNAPADWAPLLTPPAMGYDFSSTRDVPPGAMIEFSGLSSSSPTTCTYDPEDGRTGLVWSWTVVSTPPGAPMLGGGAMPQFTLTPRVPGQYQLLLTVADKLGRGTMVPITFAVGARQDLVAQLSWAGSSGVDLDVHLVRPSSVVMPADPYSGVFSFFNEGANHVTSGDINGYSVTLRSSNVNFDFDWGGPGGTDNPKLSIDDIGQGDLLESVSLNYPEHDSLCDGGRCKYKVLVHYMRDYRMSSGSQCFVDGGSACHDGDQCTCTAATDRCVTTQTDAGLVGPGECRAAPAPVVKIFLKGNPTPAATIPMPTQTVLIGAPCQTFYVADVNWPSQQEIGSLPDGGTPGADIIVRDAGFARFGKRALGDIHQCSPDYNAGSSNTPWYSEQP
jgi:hypothetical protein